MAGSSSQIGLFILVKYTKWSNFLRIGKSMFYKYFVHSILFRGAYYILSYSLNDHILVDYSKVIKQDHICEYTDGAEVQPYI